MNPDSLSFDISEDVLQLGVRGSYLIMQNLNNRSEDESFDNVKKDTLLSLSHKFDDRFIERNEVLKGFRDLHTKVQRSNKKYISSTENLIRYFLEKKDIPKINLIVDIYNLVSLKSLLALGAHDLAKIDGNIHLRLTNGTEKFWPLGAPEPKPVMGGEYCYVDDSNEIICRLEVRQVEKTKVGLDTKACFYIIQGNQSTSAEHIKETAEELVALTQKFCGGQHRILYPSE